MHKGVLAYTSLSGHLVEYTVAVWARHDIVLFQNSVIRFTRNLKGRTDIVSEVRNQLQLQFLEVKGIVIDCIP